MGILLVLVPWGYWNWRVQFYKYTIEYIIEIKKTKTDVQEDNMGHKRIDPPDLDKGYFTDKCSQCRFGLKLIQTPFFVFAPKFYLLHLENITSFKFHWGNSKKAYSLGHVPTYCLWMSFLLLVYLIILNTVPQFLLDHIPLCLWSNLNFFFLYV